MKKDPTKEQHVKRGPSSPDDLKNLLHPKNLKRKDAGEQKTSDTLREASEEKNKHKTPTEKTSEMAAKGGDDGWDNLIRPELIPPAAGVRSDDLNHTDRLKFEKDVRALSSVVASREVFPPLSIGLFGDWGVGKSFFMNEMRNRIEALADKAADVEEEKEEGSAGAIGLQEPEYWSNIAQIEFNAWHYVDDNLWASIVSRIFDGLAEHVTDPKDPILEEREKILIDIESANKTVQMLKRQQDQSRRNRQAKEEELEKKKVIRLNAERKLLSLSPLEAAKSAWKDFITWDHGFRTQLTESGYKGSLGAVDDVKRHLNDLQTTMGQLRALWNWLFQKGHGLTFIAMIIGTVMGGYLINGLLEYYDTNDGFTALGKWGTWLTGLLATSRFWLGKANTWLKDLSTKIKLYKDQEYKKAESFHRAEETKQQEIDTLREEEKQIEGQIQDEQKKIDEFEERLNDLKVGRRMFRFIQDRASASEYKDQLGIIATIRKDCKELSDLLQESSKAKRKKWKKGKDSDSEDNLGTILSSETDSDTRVQPKSAIANIDRIILYIDDLDRCPPKRVVEVLQAVHLLLAFKLFVVVVAVDSRWLLLSLEKHYPDFLKLDEEASQKKEGKTPLTRWSSTPQHYLEKIFQISLNIRRMDKTGFGLLVHDLLSTEAEKESQASPAGKGADPGHHDAQTEDLGKDTTASLHTSNDHPDYEFDLNPPQLQVKPYEMEFMSKLHSLIDTPRAVSRYVNTYRLIRATLEDQDTLTAFEEEKKGSYRIVQMLLAVLIGKPYLARYIFAGLHVGTPGSQWKTFVTNLTPKQKAKANDDFYHNNVCPQIAPIDVPRWKSLIQSLQGIKELNTVKMSEVRSWAREVVRFAIHPIQMGRSDE